MPNLLILIEQKISQKLGSRNSLRITNSVLNKGKFAISLPFKSPEVLSSASDKTELFFNKCSKNSNLDDPGMFLPALVSSLELHNISLTPKLV